MLTHSHAIKHFNVKCFNSPNSYQKYVLSVLPWLKKKTKTQVDTSNVRLLEGGRVDLGSQS